VTEDEIRCVQRQNGQLESPFSFLSASPSAWFRVTKSSSLKNEKKTPDQGKVVSQVMVHRSVVKVLGFAPPPFLSPSFSVGGQSGGLRDAGGYPTHPSQICPLCRGNKCSELNVPPETPAVIWSDRQRQGE